MLQSLLFVRRIVAACVLMYVVTGLASAQQAQPIACRLTRRIGLVSEVSILGLGSDRLVHDGDAGWSERRLPKLLCMKWGGGAITRFPA